MAYSEDFLKVAQAAMSRIKLISPEEAKLQIQTGAVLLDVREKDEFEKAHLEGAKNLSRGVLEMKISEFVPDKSTPIICYCTAGYRGALAADTLQSLGYKATSIEGGMNAYHAK